MSHVSLKSWGTITYMYYTFMYDTVCTRIIVKLLHVLLVLLSERIPWFSCWRRVGHNERGSGPFVSCFVGLVTMYLQLGHHLPTTLSISLFSVFAKRLLWSVLGGVRNHCCYLVSIDIDMNIYVVLPLLLEDYCALVQIESVNTNQRNTN